MKVKFDTFTTLEAAQDFFDKATKPAEGQTETLADGIIVKASAEWSYYLDEVWQQTLNRDKPSYLVILLEKGTKIETVSTAAETATPDPSPTPAPSPPPSPSPPTSPSASPSPTPPSPGAGGAG